ncbi:MULTISPECIES: ABC transporter substrate-binding protein [unclassified Frankia]|uniref:ABC transporter substrate-binding protein n=1 Tax=unclassified Frankia TaxID=2632575 RepID=UPI002AD3B418|nr:MULTISPECIES: ABC transporter substrate-binding protein [unclassified Frankia]
MRRARLRMIAAGLGGALALAGMSACAHGGDGAGSPRPAGSSGAPVTLMIIAPTGTTGGNYPEMVAAARAAVRGVNARGGIKGHPVELVHCNENNDGSAAAACAKQAADTGVLAVVSETSGTGGIMATLAKAGIASVGSAGVSADGSELHSPISFVLSPLVMFPAVCPSLLKKIGARHLGMVGYDLSASDRLLTLGQVGARAVQLPASPVVRVPITTSDFTPTVTQLTAAGADGAVMVVTEQAAVAVMRDGGERLSYCHATGAISDVSLEQLGPVAGRLVEATAYPELDEADQFSELRRMRAELDAEYSTGDRDASAALWKSSTSLNGWLSVQVVEKIGNQVPGALTSAALLAQLGRTTSLDLQLVPRLDFTRTNPIPGVERVFNTTLRGARWDSGERRHVSLGNETYQALDILAAGSRPLR